jgi:hypothetical protein
VNLASFLSLHLYHFQIWDECIFECGPDWARRPDDAEVQLDKWRLAMMDSDLQIRQALCDDAVTFSGIGKHLTSDLLYELALYPSMPVSIICRSDSLFSKLKVTIRHYMAQWLDPYFFESCTGVPSSSNPFEYNDKASRKYMQDRVLVFRKAEVCVPAALFNQYIREGLLDPEHTIGLSVPHNRSVVTYIYPYLWFVRPAIRLR